MKNMRLVISTIVLGALFSAFILTELVGQTGGASGAAVARRDGNITLIDGQPEMLSWAIGLVEVEDLDEYAALGLNTAYLRVTTASETALAQVSYLASAAENQDLMVVIALAPRALEGPQGDLLSIDPLSESYQEAVRDFVTTVVDGLGERPRTIAWIVEAIPPANVVMSDASFIAYLQEWYPTLARLNAAWGSDFVSWNQITIAAARDLDTLYPEGMGRASIDFAFYRESVYANSMSLWAAALRSTDPGRMVLAGTLPDYRSIISLRTDFDGMVLTTYPTVAEEDWDTHNVHAVDIARRGNQFAAIQTLRVAEDITTAALTSWGGAALAHGATGIAFSSWSAIKNNDAFQESIRDLFESARGLGYPIRPQANVALLYQPFSGGAMRRGVSLYGYLDGVGPSTPTTIFTLARAGTRYGIIDVLTWEDLTAERLANYRVLIAPMAFYLPDDAQLAIQNFVLRGGAFLADLGVGMYQAEGITTSMPPIIREVFGLRYLDLESIRPREQTFGPEVHIGEVYDPALLADTYRLAPFQDPSETIDPALTRFVQQLELFLTQADVARFLGDSFINEAGAGLRVRGTGRGFAVYAPEFLYEVWSPADYHFHDFHDRVLSYRAVLEVVEPFGIWPGVSATLQQDRTVSVASPSRLPVATALHGISNQVYLVPRGAMRVGDESEIDMVELLFPGEPISRALPLPIRLWPYGEGAVATVKVMRYDREGVELVIHGLGANVAVRNGEITIQGGIATPIELAVQSGRYPIRTDTVYRVTIRQLPTERVIREQELMPVPEAGALVITENIAAARITIETVE